ncbi:adenosinetriphosphatase [Phakopsora pachyrhizi]|nr:adenosinetriphosphatase [Phakopsora pachyrhizi]
MTDKHHHHQVNLRLCPMRCSLVNLPPILASRLSSQSILPQSLAIELRRISRSDPDHRDPNQNDQLILYVGWTGLTTSKVSQLNLSNQTSDSKQIRSPNFLSPSSMMLNGNNRNKHGLKDLVVETIEMDESIGDQMAWKTGDRLEIRFFHSQLKRAKTVNVEPISIDDWEILESNPEYLEDNLLSQIRVLSQSQTLLVWLYGKTLIKLKVISIESSSMATSRPSDSGLTNDQNRVPYLITNETEIIVSPKTRQASHLDNRKEQILEPTKTHRSSNDGGYDDDDDEAKRIYLKILPRAFIKAQKESSFQGEDDDDGNPIVEINSIQFSNHLQIFYPTTLCSLSLIMRPNKDSVNSKTISDGIDPSTQKRSNRSTTTLNRSKASSLKRGTTSSESISDRVRVVPSETVPFGFLKVSDRFRKVWLSGLPSRHDGKLSGDYEYVRIGSVRGGRSLAESAAEDFAESKNCSRKTQKQGSSDDDGSEEEDEEEDEVFLAGFDQQLKFCLSYLRRALIKRAYYDDDGLNGSIGHGRRVKSQIFEGLMICGPSGSGKSTIVKKLIERVSLESDLMLYSSYIDCGKYVDERLGSIKSKFLEWFEVSVWYSPSILVLDDLDKLLPAEHIDSFRNRILTEELISTISSMIRDETLRTKGLLLIVTCSNKDNLHKLLNCKSSCGVNLVDEVLDLKGLSIESRKQILVELIELKLVRSNQKLEVREIEKVYESVGAKTEGYLVVDLKDLIDRVIHLAIIRSLKLDSLSKQDLQKDLDKVSTKVVLELKDFESAISDFLPISIRDLKLKKSNVQWSDIGGLNETRRVLRETLEWPNKYSKLFVNCPLRLRSGLLLYGYPGCGKTLLASAIAKECGLNFISIKGPELLNKYIGASEKSVRDIFDRAQAARPCVLFFDEFESIAPKRGHDSTGVTDRVVNQLLTQMDGAEGLEGVYVLAATSRPDLIDPALLRPGRLDKSLLCSMPNERERIEILIAVSRSLKLDDDVRFEEVAERTEGFTGADLQALIYSSHLKVAHECIESKKVMNNKDNKVFRSPEDSNDSQCDSNKGIIDNDGGMKEVQKKLNWIELSVDDQDQLIKNDGEDEGPPHNIFSKKSKSRAELESTRKMIEVVLRNTKKKRTEGMKKRTNKLEDEDGVTNSLKNSNENFSSKSIRMRHILSVLEETRSSVPREELIRLTKIYQSFVSSRSDGGLPDGVASDLIGGRASLM